MLLYNAAALYFLFIYFFADPLFHYNEACRPILENYKQNAAIFMACSLRHVLAFCLIRVQLWERICSRNVCYETCSKLAGECKTGNYSQYNKQMWSNFEINKNTK